MMRSLLSPTCVRGWPALVILSADVAPIPVPPSRVASRAVAAAPASQQGGLERRVRTASATAVQFHMAARPGACGDGRSYLRVEDDTWYGTVNDATRALPCEAGPLRILAVKDGEEILRLQSFVGPLANAADATDLGRVAPAEGVAFLGALAERSTGRVPRDAIWALGIADSADVSTILVRLVRGAERPRESRRSALSALVRRRDAPDAPPAGVLVALLSGLARDGQEHHSLRQTALTTLSRLDRGEGIPTLIPLAGATDDPWLAREAVDALARSGDPRALRVVRDIVSRAEAPAEARMAAMNGLAREYATSADAETLARTYATLPSDRLRDAALGAMAQMGGASSRRFLLGVVEDETHPARQRRRAASLLDRAGVSVREVIATYDKVSDGEVRVQLIEAMAQAGTRDATRKLMAIAQGDTQLTARRRAIALLGRSEDPAVREALKDMVNSR
jgi:HEAT repeat protein